MRKSTATGLAIVIAILAFGLVLQLQGKAKPRALYTYSFGGIEDMEVAAAVNLLGDLGYAGIATEARGEEALNRMSRFYDWSNRKGGDFEVVAAFMAHRFGKYGFSDAGHKAAIDRLEGKDGTLWGKRPL